MNHEIISRARLMRASSLGAHYLRTIIQDGEATVSGYVCDFSEPKLYCMGSGSQWYLSEIEKHKPTYQPWNSLVEAIRSDDVPDVGGAIQVALATHCDVVLPQVVMDTPDRGVGISGRFFLGRMNLEQVGGASVGHFVVRD